MLRLFRSSTFLWWFLRYCLSVSIVKCFISLNMCFRHLFTTPPFIYLLTALKTNGKLSHATNVKSHCANHNTTKTPLPITLLTSWSMRNHYSITSTPLCRSRQPLLIPSLFIALCIMGIVFSQCAWDNEHILVPATWNFTILPLICTNGFVWVGTWS